MEFVNFLKTNNLTNFDEIKAFLTAEPLSLKVKTDKSFPNLYLVTYTRGRKDFSSPVVACCRGLILEKGTNRIVCYTFDNNRDFDYSLDGDEAMKNFDDFDYEKCTFEEALDGTQVRLFFYEGEWRMATTRCIDASHSWWYSKKSFAELFAECGVDTGVLNKSCCYSFLLQHPDNRIVVKYDTPRAVLVGVRSLEDGLLELNAVDEAKRLGFDGVEMVGITSFDNLLTYQRQNEMLNSEGVMVRQVGDDGVVKRMKVQTETYRTISAIRGNSRSDKYRYYHLLKTDRLTVYRTYFPEDNVNMAFYQYRTGKMIRSLHHWYYQLNVKKSCKMKGVPFHFRPLVYKLHGEYLKTKEITKLPIVWNLFKSLVPEQMCFIYNNEYEKKSDDEAGDGDNNDEDVGEEFDYTGSATEVEATEAEATEAEATEAEATEA